MARVSHVVLLAVLGCISGMRSAAALSPHLPIHAMTTDHWNVEQGLPQITVTGIAEDRAGFLWVNTQATVARFDGKQFVAFDRAATGIDTSMLTAIWADPQGQVWFGGARGLLREQQGHFTALGGDAVNAIIDAGDGTPLLATSNGLAHLRAGRIVAVPGYRGPAFSLLRDGATLWVGGLGRVCRVVAKPDSPGATCIALDAGHAQMEVMQLASNRGHLWLGTRTGLLRLDGDRIVAAGLGNELDTTSIESLLADRNGNLWIGTVPGLYRLLPDGVLEEAADDDIAPKPWVHALHEDRDGNLWLGTHTNGLYRIWNGWTHRVSSRDGLADPLVWSVARAPDGRIVLGTNSDVEIYDGHGVHPWIAGNRLPNPSAYELYYDRHGRLWVGTRGGIAVFDGARDITPPALSALASLQIDDVREVADDDVWIGTTGGLYRWHAGRLDRLDAGSSAPASIIRSILPLTPDHLYFGTEDGVREWRDGKLVQPAWAEPLRGHFVSRVALLGPGLLGVATTDAGVGVVANGSLRMTTQKDGLPGDNAWSLDVLGGNLYAGTINGVWRLPMAQLPMPGSPGGNVVPQQLAGEQRLTRLRGSHCCNGGGGARSLVIGATVWYSTTDGMLGIDTRALIEPPKPPDARIESVERGGRLLPAGALDLTDGSRDLVIHYTAPYLHVGELHFRYRLDGYDTDWQEVGARRAAFYTHLPPGKYRFRVAVSLPGASGFGREADIAIRIEPRWHERILVRVAAVLLAVLVIALLVVWNQRAQRRRSAQLEMEVERRTAQLARAVERLRVANLALAEESHTDALTKLHNRRYLLRLLPGLLANHRRIGVLQIDIDYFKQVNDNYGHAAGDAVLRALGSLLLKSRRIDDIAVRWGGEEFLLLLPGAEVVDAQEVAGRLCREIAEQDFADGRGGRIRLTGSVGFSQYPLAAHPDSGNFDAVLELADLALYRAKQDGRNTCVGLVATSPLLPEILAHPMAPQIGALVAAGRLRWVRAER
ncbi:diguanylate cyclase [Rhodanobacter sp. 7MK24]|uniref:ligand-binding sensor domain-containing diguanylate cyclase n=1 Tax=Rhodanobacter sp. 7MK24 TaxID=2775922 RepID=UPI00177A88E0|nr:ligand-binding sensor domain-containing diguanylate cyclase [Rhodanobacter sp. 7MK24]MBD8881185.1 diguanylate cyclase [Rhodanobacter sp. 7MK24]